MNQFIINAGGKTLDTYDDINISFNYQIEDILDITKRNSSYSKTIKLPGTPTNNQFFKQIFQVDIDAAFFNPNKKIYCEIKISDNQILTGDLQLLDILINNKKVEYEIVVTGQLKSILFDLGELTLRNLNLSEFNHVRSKANIQNSWIYKIKVNNNDVQYGQGGTGYVYPYIINGNSSDVFNRLYCYDQYPAVYVKTIVDKIFELAGYTYTSNFFNSDYFKKLILPYVNDKIEKTAEIMSAQTTVVGVNGSNPESSPGLNNGYSPTFNEPSPTGYRAITPLLNHGYGWYKNYNFTYYIGLDRESGEVGDKDYQDPLNSWTNYGGQPDPFSNYVCQASGYYDISFTGQLIIKYMNLSFGTITFQDGKFAYYYRLWKIKATGGSVILDQSTSIPLEFQPGFANNSPFITYDLTTPLTFGLSASNHYLEVGDKLLIEFAFRYNESPDFAGDDNNILVQALLKESLGGNPTYFSVTPSSNSDSGTDTQIDMNQILPSTVKIKDFLLDIIKMFNLVVADDKYVPNNFIIEPREDYYRSKPKVKDWTYIKDNDSEIKIIPLSELDAKVYRYTYREDDDYYNEQYKKDVNRIYGDAEFEVDNDFSNTTNELMLGFSPTPNAQLYIYDRSAPFFIDLEDNTMSPRKVNTRILFYGGLKDTGQSYILKDFPSQPDSQGVTLTKYAYCGMWDDPISPEYDLSFNNPLKVYYEIDQYPVKTLIEQFHKSTFQQITDINSRLMEAFFYLTPSDIADFDFRDIIFIDNTYWRVIKINDYDPIGSDKVTKVTLFKITDLKIYSPNRVEIPASNSACPVDIVGKFDKKKRPYYVSLSNQPISEECCKSLKGKYKNGVCWGFREWVKPNPISSGTLTGILPYDGSPITDKLTTNLMADNKSPNSPDIILRGKGAFVGDNVKNGIVLGDGSTITSNVKNTIIVGDNLNATENDTIYLDRIKINNDGIVSNYVYIIDAGQDEVMKVNKTNLIDKLDGGIDSVRNYGGDSKLRPIIDGSISPFGSVQRP